MPRRVELGHLLSARRPAALRPLNAPPPTAPGAAYLNAAPDAACLDAAWLRARLTGPDRDDPDVGSAERSAAAWIDDASHAPDTPLTPAAVLVPVVTGPNPGVLLTRRTDTLRRHSGQVSFPGGRIDSTDASPEEAAMREAHEEVGLDPASVELLGRMRDYVTSTGYRITPVLGLITPGYTTRPSAAEVAYVFELPLTTLLDPNAPEQRSIEYQGRIRNYWVWPHPTQYIWGATAAILVHLAHRLRGP